MIETSDYLLPSADIDQNLMLSEETFEQIINFPVQDSRDKSGH